jgi:hypothetical protein
MNAQHKLNKLKSRLRRLKAKKTLTDRQLNRVSQLSNK